ncbi:MAG: DUF4159 domain-containing protein [Steroidobacteraceae bacterium]
MQARHLPKWLIATVGLTVAALACAQGFGRRIVQNDPPRTEFVAARWHFGTNGYIGHLGWSHNYPQSDRNLNGFLKRALRLDVEENSYRIVELGSDEVFDHPFAYVSEPGEMELTETEARNLREYVGRGGFVLMDDFDGPVQWETMRSEVKRVFPDSEFVALEVDHPVFRSYAPLDGFGDMAEHMPGGRITYYGLFDEQGNLAILAGLNNDLANFWEWYGDGAYPLKPATDAFRLGTNAVLYALTH